MARKYLIPTSDLVQVARGFLMGGADIIPGVSGGTVALILGIYDRLVTAISRFDMTFVRQAVRREWRAAAAHADLRFLIALGAGIGLGILGLASLMNYLLLEHTQLTFGAFFGLIVASSVLVGRMVQWERSTTPIACLVGGALAAYYIVGLPFLNSPPEGLLYVLFSGLLAICAMILPGISGAFILLLLGKYEDITGHIRNVPHRLLAGEFPLDELTVLAVFAVGCTVGLLSFSKFLRWLLARHENATMALLCGFMAGSLRKIWPFKLDTTPDVEKFKEKVFENIPIAELEFDGMVFTTLLVIILAAAAVMLLDYVTKGHEHIPEVHEPAADEEGSV
jgi:putative membrane protein